MKDEKFMITAAKTQYPISLVTLTQSSISMNACKKFILLMLIEND